MTDAQPERSVADAPERSRFEIIVDGRLAGFAEYQLGDGVITFTHTEIGDEYAGQGLGSTLVRTALDDVRARGLSVRPLCPYVAAYIKRHPEYADLVA
ncbi:GNAT family N-acetyltransferase [Solicola gregarius]|uniref:N-acetyltransferase n=1 Tax=Solicola gregarius TaxID=2908642 RepID=A0AA46YJF3_9ACTN|nr:GNAT family N-acetyltransferase [Solicola gregarius]UYM03509.1 N-acetyltransferase [Solicola gregarius]